VDAGAQGRTTLMYLKMKNGYVYVGGPTYERLREPGMAMRTTLVRETSGKIHGGSSWKGSKDDVNLRGGG